MAVAYRAGAVGGTTTGTSTGLSITVPTSGSGGSVVAGDVAFACIETGGANTYSAAPSGWTQRALTTNAQSSITGAIYSKTLVSGDINAAASWTINAAAQIAASIDIFSGVLESACTYSSMSVSTGTTITSPTITVTSGGVDLGFWMGTTASGAGYTFTKDATYTAASTRATSVASGANRTMGTAFISASGSTVGVGCTFSASTSRNAAFSINVAPPTALTLTGSVVDLAIAPKVGAFAAVKGLYGTLADTFSSSLDTTQKWKNSTGTGGISTAGGVCTIVGNSALLSSDTYCLTGSSIFLKITPATGTGHDTYIYFGWVTSDTAGGGTIYLRVNSPTNTLETRYTDTTASGGADHAFTGTGIAYDATNHAWIKLAESGGVVTMSTAPDGVTWTSRMTATTGLNLNGIVMSVFSSFSGGGTVVVDNVNTAPSSPVTLTGITPAGIALAPLTGTVGAAVTLTGTTPPGITATALAGSVTIEAAPATAANLAIAYVPNGTVNAAATLAGTSPPGTAIAPLAGTVTSAQNMVPTVAADLAVTALVGTVQAAVTLVGAAPPGIAIAPLTGTFGGSLIVAGNVADLALTALQGDVVAERAVTLAGTTPPGIALAPLTGTVHAGVTLAGEVAPMGLVAPAGTVFAGIPVTLAGELATLDLSALMGFVGSLRDIAVTLGVMVPHWSATSPTSAWSTGEPRTNSPQSGEVRR